MSPSSLYPGAVRSVSEWTAQELENLVRDGVPESQSLEFKEAGYFTAGEDKAPTKDQKKRREMAKDIAAMANASGGVLIVGVAEHDGRAGELRPVSERDADTEERWMRQTLASWLTSVPAFNVTPVDLEAGYVLVVEIPPSSDAPHALSLPGDASQSLSYPVRRGTSTAYLTEPEVAAAYRARQAGRENRNARTEEVLGRALERTPAAEPSPWVWVLAVPDRSLPDRPMRGNVVAELADWQVRSLAKPLNVGPFGHHLQLQSRPLPGPGFLAVSDAGAATATTYAELHVGGLAFVTDQLSHPKRRGFPSALSSPTLVERVMLAVDYALRFAVDTAGTFGAVDVHCGIAWLPDNPVVFTDPLQIWTADEGEWGPRTGLRDVVRAPRSVVTFDAGLATTVRGRLIAAHDVALALQVHFGLADASFLSEDGSVFPLYRSQQEIRAWAANFSIDVIDGARPVSR